MLTLLKIKKYLLFIVGLILLFQFSELYAQPNITPLSKDIEYALRVTGDYNNSCQIRLDRLVVVHFLYCNMAGKCGQKGEIIVLDTVAEHVLKIFQELAQMQFPLQSAVIPRPDQLGNIFIPENNTVSFNCRTMRGSNHTSIHSYGLAIDINPIQNPSILPVQMQMGMAMVLPPEGMGYLNRLNQRPGMAEPIINIFYKHGFYTWGGQWNEPIDWMHFQPSDALAQLLATMSKEDGQQFFELYIKFPKFLNTIEPNDMTLINYYKKDPKKFIKLFFNNPQIMNMSSENALPALKEKWHNN